MKGILCVIFLCVQCAPIHSLLFKQFLDDFIDNQLYFGYKEFFNTTRKHCVWRDAKKHRQLCPKEVRMDLYSNGQQETVDTTDKNWLNKSATWDRNKENVFFVHGYAGGDYAPPRYVMQDALVHSGRYNAFMLDYGPVSRAPCFVQAVQNINYVSNCIASYINRFEQTGMPAKSIICIGHSIGAHICGRLKKKLRFRLKKIIGLDPALPLIKESERLSYRDAERVHTISTNAGVYGDIGSIGHVDVCVNNGNVQPFCVDERNANLCSHLWALCFTAQSLFSDYQLHAKKCTQVCPHFSVFQYANKFNRSDRRSSTSFHTNVIKAKKRPDSIQWGLDIPKSVRGSYCMTALTPPFCPKYLNGFGTERCCSLIKMLT